MTDEKKALADAIGSLLAPRSLGQTHAATVVDQDPKGTVGVQIASGSPASIAKPVPLRFGLPCFTAIFNPGCPIAIGFDEDDESKAYAGGFPFYPIRANDAIPPPPPMPIVSLHFGGGTRSIARVDDTVDCGSLIITQAPVGPLGVPSTLTVVYQPPGGQPPVVVITFPIPGPAIIPGVNPLIATIALAGIITSGREEFKA
jgi:hypothetical protein